MKTNKIYIFLAIFVAALFVSCEGSFDFNKEQYAKQLYIMGGSNAFQIYDRNMANLNQETDTLYITVGVGGSAKSDKDIKITIAPADSLFKAYNKSNFDTAKTKWAKMLPPDNYTLLTNEAVIKAGEMTATIPVELKNLSKLSPDSVYFLDYKISDASGYVVTLDRNEALFRIYYKNNWSNTKSTADQTYMLTAQRWTQGNNDTLKIAGSPRVFPLSKNTVRTVATNSPNLPITTVAEIYNNSIVLHIDNNNKVTYSPYKTILIEALPAANPNNPYNNTFVNEINKISEGKYTYYKTFWLRYRYKLNPKDINAKWIVVEARLRHQYNPLTEL